MHPERVLRSAAVDGHCRVPGPEARRGNCGAVGVADRAVGQAPDHALHQADVALPGVGDENRGQTGVADRSLRETRALVVASLGVQDVEPGGRTAHDADGDPRHRRSAAPGRPREAGHIGADHRALPAGGRDGVVAQRRSAGRRRARLQCGPVHLDDDGGNVAQRIVGRVRPVQLTDLERRGRDRGCGRGRRGGQRNGRVGRSALPLAHPPGAEGDCRDDRHGRRGQPCGARPAQLGAAAQHGVQRIGNRREVGRPAQVVAEELLEIGVHLRSPSRDAGA